MIWPPSFPNFTQFIFLGMLFTFYQCPKLYRSLLTEFDLLLYKHLSCLKMYKLTLLSYFLSNMTLKWKNILCVYVVNKAKLLYHKPFHNFFMKLNPFMLFTNVITILRSQNNKKHKISLCRKGRNFKLNLYIYLAFQSGFFYLSSRQIFSGYVALNDLLIMYWKIMESRSKPNIRYWFRMCCKD